MILLRGLRRLCKRTDNPQIICVRLPVAEQIPICRKGHAFFSPALALPKMERFFHSSTAVGLPVRRRRYNIGNTEDDNTENRTKDSDAMGIGQPAVTDPEIFARESAKLMDKIFNSLDPLKALNENYILTRGHEEEVGDFILLDLGPVRGQYNIQVDLKEKVVILQSPISGQLLYILSASTGDWCGDVDGHRFEGLLVRDLIRQINGVPNF